MDQQGHDECIVHVRHCMAYKKIIMGKVIGPIKLPNVIDKAIFAYVGFFPIVSVKTKTLEIYYTPQVKN
jgi:hypothetical protein